MAIFLTSLCAFKGGSVLRDRRAGCLPGQESVIRVSQLFESDL